ncbi:hypothetical protein [Mycobacterium sherrisii]|uniref:hypothetical protein n=1 Tax=Mycobacterium sherrisii TaxID=243061 RepID=UPI001301D3C2|nr:hypothetical protein [Mycobacterium sherrisii]MCV7032476.1 hypothetical protein [Mycobacterium sherrisii]
MPQVQSPAAVIWPRHVETPPRDGRIRLFKETSVIGVAHEDADAANQAGMVVEANLVHPNTFQRYDDAGSHRAAVSQRHIEIVHPVLAISLYEIHLRNFYFAS